jgi:alpha-L-rhamnosidase
MKKLTLTLLLLSFSFIYVNASNDAKWITTSDNQNAVNTWLCFQKVSTIKTVPQTAIARIAADSKYWLWINGKMVVIEGAVKRGPNPNDTYFDKVNIAPYLHSGKNIISVLVWYYGKKGFSYNPSGSAALFFDCSTKAFSLVSDASWKGKVHPAYFSLGKPEPNYRLPESCIGFDARIDIPRWESNECNDWTSVKVLGKEGSAPWNKLHYRVIPLWKDFGLANYVSENIHKGTENDTLICKLPYNAQVMPYIELESKAGNKLTIETSNVMGGGAYNVRAEYIAKDGYQVYENKGWMNGEKVYYIYPKGVKILKVMFRETGYDTTLKGSFTCDDTFFNTLWKKAQRTLYITMRDTYMDCPDRERAQWWGDETVESGESFYALSPSSRLLMKKGMYELIGWQHEDGALHAPVPASNYDKELPGQMLASVGYYGFWNYYINTGDLQAIKDLYPGVKKYLGVWEKDENGNIKPRTKGWIWGDWGDNIDKTAIFGAWYYIALKGQLNMAKALNLKDDVVKVEKEMKGLKSAFNKVFWTGKEYRSTNYKDDTDDRVQALAVISGIADADKYPAILDVFKHCEHASPYMEKYVAEALFRMGQGEYGLMRLKKRFGFMVNNKNYSTLFEGWGIGLTDGYGGGTTNHAWSGGGLTILSQYVCGVSPIKPAFREFIVSPNPAGIKQAETLIPSISGNIKVSFEDNQTNFNLKVISPNHTIADIILPGNYSKVMINGKLIWVNGKSVSNSSNIKLSKSESGKPIFKLLKSGNYTISCEKL